MTPTTLENTDTFMAAIATAFEQLQGVEPFADLRAAAYDHFLAQGLPTTKHENWKYTSLKPLTKTAFVLPDFDGTGEPAVTAGGLRKYAIPQLEAVYLVQINGRYVPAFSDLSGLGEGVTVLPLSEAIRQKPKLVNKYLGQLVKTETDAMSEIGRAHV